MTAPDLPDWQHTSTESAVVRKLYSQLVDQSWFGPQQVDVGGYQSLVIVASPQGSSSTVIDFMELLWLSGYDTLFGTRMSMWDGPDVTGNIHDVTYITPTLSDTLSISALLNTGAGGYILTIYGSSAHVYQSRLVCIDSIGSVGPISAGATQVTQNTPVVIQGQCSIGPQTLVVQAQGGDISVSSTAYTFSGGYSGSLQYNEVTVPVGTAQTISVTNDYAVVEWEATAVSASYTYMTFYGYGGT